jgi:hypothetical protein
VANDNVIEYSVSAVDDFSATHDKLASQYAALDGDVVTLNAKMEAQAAITKAATSSMGDLELGTGRERREVIALAVELGRGEFAQAARTFAQLGIGIGGLALPLGIVAAGLSGAYALWENYQKKAAEAAASAVDDFTKIEQGLEGEIALLRQRNELMAAGVTGQNDDQTKFIATLHQRILAEAALVDQLQRTTVNESFASAAVANLKSDVERYSTLVNEVAEKNALEKALNPGKSAAEKLREAIQATTLSMQAQVMTFGMGSDAAKIYELQTKGATEAQLAQLEMYSKLHMAEEQSVKDKATVKSIVDSLESPEEKHNQRVKELNDLHDRGVMTQRQYNLAIEDESAKWDVAAAHSKQYMDGLSGMVARLTVLERAHQRQLGDMTTQISGMISGTFDMVAKGVGDAVGQVIMHGGSLADALEKVMQQVAQHIISALITIEIQQAIFHALGLAAAKTQATGEVADAAGVAYAGTFAQVMTSIPWPYSVAIAPEAAVAAAIGVEAGAMPFIAAHGGMDYVPAETTYLLDKGERVVSPNQNRDLTDFLAGKQKTATPGQTITIAKVEVHIMENATTADAFLKMNPQQLRQALGRPVIDALNSMNRIGVKPDFAMQNK